MTTGTEQQEPSDKDTCTSATEDVAAAPSADCGTRSVASRTAQSHRMLAFAAAIPAVLIVGVGLHFVLQDNSTADPKTRDLEAAYAALKGSSTGNIAASVHTRDIDSLVERLEGSLKAHPDDVDGWRVLGWSHFRKQRFDKAADAYRHAAELSPGSAALKSLHGEALVASAKGQVTMQARNAFKSALALDPNDVRAQFFSGQAQIQDGDTKSALDTWIALLKTAPEGAGWATDLRERILEVSRQSGTDISGSLREAPRAASVTGTVPNGAVPTAKDIENAGKLTPQAREAMARNMVERLAKRLETSPNDPDGWIMLIRSRTVLGETTEAKAALEQAMDVFAAKHEIKERIRLAAQALNVTPGE